MSAQEQSRDTPSGHPSSAPAPVAPVLPAPPLVMLAWGLSLYLVWLPSLQHGPCTSRVSLFIAPLLLLMSVTVTILTRVTSIRFLRVHIHSLKQHPLVELLGEMTGGGFNFITNCHSKLSMVAHAYNPSQR